MGLVKESLRSSSVTPGQAILDPYTGKPADAEGASFGRFNAQLADKGFILTYSRPGVLH